MKKGKAASTDKSILGKSESNNGKLESETTPLAQPPKCPECTSQKIWRDGLRYRKQGEVQRYLCRSCGYRFSEPNIKVNITAQPNKLLHPGANLAKQVIGNRKTALKKRLDSSLLPRSENIRSHGSKPQLITTIGKDLNVFPHYNSDCQVCVSEREAKNLSQQQKTRQKRAAGATKPTSAEDKGKIIEFAWWLKKQGYRETTIRVAAKRLAVLVKRGANLLDPETVKEIIATQPWAEATKLNAVKVYTLFLKMQGTTWEQPIYKAVRKVPFIPTEREIDTLIAACGKKLSTFLQLAKETGARSGELQNLDWTDLDAERRNIRITAEKNSNPRILEISSKCLGMLQALPRTSERIFGDITYNTMRTGFLHQRKKIAKKLNNPRLKNIHFHTLRHWKATMLYHRTKDILYVMQCLGVARKPEEIKQLLEVGFEFVCEKDGLLYFRKRK